MSTVLRTASGIAVELHEGTGGTPLLLAHGQLADRRSLAPSVAPYLGSRPVALVDLPWHGESARPAEPDAAAFGRALLDALDALGWRRAVGIGHSLGTAAVLDAALSAPARFERMVLVGLVGDFGDEERALYDSYAPVVAGGISQAVSELLTVRWYSEGYRSAHPEQVDVVHACMQRNDPTAAATVFRAVARMPVRAPRAAGLGIPTTVIAAREDQATPLVAARPLVDALRASVIELAGGHFPFEERPEEFAGALRDAL